MAIFDKLSGISADNGFVYQSEAPLDARLVVDTFEELAELVAGHGAYAGMLVYVKNDAKYYSYNGSAWAELKTAGPTITISTEEPSAGSNGDIWFKY